MPIEVPNTLTLTNHGMLITAGPGIVVGAISDWRPEHSQTVTAVYAFGGTPVAPNDTEAARGEPYENVPGNVQNMSIAVSRYDIITSLFEAAFGTPDLEMLGFQSNAIQCREFVKTPQGALDFHWIYHGCWFSRLGRTHSASQDRIVKVEATLNFTRRRKIV